MKTLHRLPSLRVNKLLQTTIAAALALGAGVAAQAQDLSIQSNQVNITQSSGGFSVSPTITSGTGVVADVTGVPMVAGINVPNFGFTLEGGSSVTNGSYPFTAGVVIQDAATSRRVEIKLPTLTLTFSGGTMSGTVASGNSTVLGRSANGSVEVAGTVNDNGSAAITNNTVQFNASSVLTKIAANASPLSDILNTINAGGAYTYTVVMKQDSGTALRLGTSSGGVLTQFPKLSIAGCDSGYQTAGGTSTNPTSVFVINGNQLAADFANGYALTGRLAITGSPIAGTLGNIGISCQPVTGGGGGGSTTTAEDTAINNEADDFLDDLTETDNPTTEQLEEVNTFISASLEKVVNGEASPTVVSGLLDVLVASLDKQSLGIIGGSGGQAGIDTTLATLALVETAINSLQGKTLTDEAKANFIDQVADTAEAFKGVLERSNGIVRSDIVAGLTSMGSAISAAASVLGDNTVSANLATLGNDISNQAIALQNQQSGSSFPRIRDVRLLLSSANSRIIGNSPLLSGDAESGSGEFAATIVNALNPNDTTIDTANGLVTAQSSLLGAINVAGSSASFNAATGVTEIRTGSTVLPTFMVDTALIGSDYPTGVAAIPNGAATTVKDGIASTFVPAPRDLIGLITALEAAGIVVTIESDGSLDLTTSIGEHFVGTFGFDHVNSGTLTSAPVTFTYPVGNPASASYTFRAIYSDGSTQNILPFISSVDFYDALEDYEIDVVTDRSTGVIYVAGGVKLRPDYFVKPNTGSDLIFHNSFKDSFGLAYRRSTDFNSDGIADYEIISSTEKQTIFVLP